MLRYIALEILGILLVEYTCCTQSEFIASLYI